MNNIIVVTKKKIQIIIFNAYFLYFPLNLYAKNNGLILVYLWERRGGIQTIDIKCHKKMSLHLELFFFFLDVIQYIQQIILVGHYFKIVKEARIAWEGRHLLEI